MLCEKLLKGSNKLYYSNHKKKNCIISHLFLNRNKKCGCVLQFLLEHRHICIQSLQCVSLLTLM